MNRVLLRIAAIVLLGMAPIQGCTSDNSGADQTTDASTEADAETHEPSVTMTCDTPEDLTAALEAASAGDGIELNPGSYEGSFTIPPGVTVKGTGDVTIIAEGGAGIIVTAGAEHTTTISNLTVRGTEGAVLVMSTDATQPIVNLDRLTIEAETGFGLALEGVRATLKDITLHGPITSADDSLLNTIGSTIDSREAAVFGAIAHDSSLEIENMSLTGFAGFGAAFINSAVDWNSGVLQYCIGSSIFAEASSVVLSNLTIADGTTGRSVSALNAISYGVAMTGESDVVSQGLTIERIKGVGIFAHASTSTHDALSLSESRLNGVWVQDTETNSGYPALSISNALIEDNGSSAVVIRDSFGLEIDNSDIRGTVLRPVISGLEIDNHGDGVQIIGTSGRISMNTVTMHANERVGMLLDGGLTKNDDSTEYLLSDVYVTTEDQSGIYGLLTQHGAPMREDLTGVVVDDILAEADAAATLDGTVLTTLQTNDTVPSSGSIITQGLIGTNGIIGTNGAMRVGGVTVTNGVVGAN